MLTYLPIGNDGLLIGKSIGAMNVRVVALVFIFISRLRLPSGSSIVV